MIEENPYAAPQAEVIPRDSLPIVKASAGLRLANLVIDYIAQMVVGGVIGFVWGMTMQTPLPGGGLLIGIVVLIGYYTVMEAACGMT